MPRFVIALIAVACSGRSAAPPEPAAELVIRRVAVIDVERGTVVPDRDVVIERGAIREVVAADDRRPARRELDGRGRFVVPGFIEMHAHLLLHPWDERGQIMPAHDDEATRAMLRTMLEHGITTVRDPGAPTEHALALRAALADGRVVGPRLVTAGRMLTAGAMALEPFTQVTSEADVRAQIAAQASAGVDWIKVYGSMPEPLVAVAIDDAHRRGLRIAGHLQATTWTAAARLGIDSVEHPAPWSADLVPPPTDDTARGLFARVRWLEQLDLDAPAVRSMIAELVRHRVAVDLTLIGMHSKFWGDDARYTQAPDLRLAPPVFVRGWPRGSFTRDWTPDQYAAAKRAWPKLLGLARRLHAAGALLVVGTDTPTPWIIPGVSFHQELRLLADAAIPAPALLRAATLDGARSLGLDRELGRVAPGLRADLVVLVANPLDDIANTSRIEHVIQRGVVVR